MMYKIISVEPKSNYKVFIEFENKKSGVVDLSDQLWGEAFEKLKQPEFFNKVSIIKDLGTIGWPNGVDIAPEFLYEQLQEVLK